MFTRLAGCSKRPDILPAQPRCAGTRRSTDAAAASDEARWSSKFRLLQSFIQRRRADRHDRHGVRLAVAPLG
jgi:hypothetical protein